MAVALLELGGLFAAVALAGWVARRVGLSAIVAYVLVGVLVGPHVLGTVSPVYVHDTETITVLAELGIVLLLFFLGLEFSLDRLLATRANITRAGLVDLAVNFPVGVLVGLAFGWSALEAVLLGGIVYVSSSAIITKSLIDLGWIADREAEPILGTLVFEDLAIAVYLAVVVALLGGTGGVASAATTVAISLGFLVALVAVVRFGSAVFERLLDTTGQEAFVLRALGLTVPVAGAALAVGVSEAVAAFFVGMGFSGTEHVHRLEELLTPLRDAFAAVFFAYIGLQTDPVLVAGVAVPLAVLVALTTPTKLVSGFLAGRTFGLGERRSLRVGTTMITRGEFSLIIANVALAAGTSVVTTEVIPALAVGYVLVMSLLGSAAMERSDRLFEHLAPRFGWEG